MQKHNLQSYAHCFKLMEVVVSVGQMKIKAGGMIYLNSPDQNKLEWNLSCSVCGRYCLSKLPLFTSSNASQRSFLEISALCICFRVVFPVFQHACKTSCIPFSWLSVLNMVVISSKTAPLILKEQVITQCYFSTEMLIVFIFSFRFL